MDQLMATRNNNLERDGIQATVLCTHNEDVDTINEEKIQSLEGDESLSKLYIIYLFLNLKTIKNNFF